MRRYILLSVLMSLLLSTNAFAGYVDNGSGTVTDTVTNLVWQKCSAGQVITDCTGTATAYDWEQAMLYCENMALPLTGRFTDWRLPNVKELSSLVDDSRTNPSIDPVFANTQTSYYWSSTTFSPNPLYAWYVNFSYGYTNYSFNKPDTYYVRCVRGQ